MGSPLREPLGLLSRGGVQERDGPLGRLFLSVDIAMQSEQRAAV